MKGWRSPGVFMRAQATIEQEHRAKVTSRISALRGMVRRGTATPEDVAELEVLLQEREQEKTAQQRIRLERMKAREDWEAEQQG